MISKEKINQWRTDHEEFCAEVESLTCYDERKEEFELEYAIAKQIHDARKAAHLTQKELTEKMHTSQNVVSRIENARMNVSIHKLAAYAHVCGKRLDVKFV